ncbi:hypothetical protein LP420_38865 [Massilia sp. B-10]|nr:hypothetical protein LP420_38865 [Massilia sp. B-10]
MSDGAFAILSVAIAIVWGVFFYPPPAPAIAAPTPSHPVKPAIAMAVHSLALLDQVAHHGNALVDPAHMRPHAGLAAAQGVPLAPSVNRPASPPATIDVMQGRLSWVDQVARSD